MRLLLIPCVLPPHLARYQRRTRAYRVVGALLAGSATALALVHRLLRNMLLR